MKILFCLLAFCGFVLAKPSQEIEPLSQKAREIFELQKEIFTHKDKKYQIFIAKTKGDAQNYKLFLSLDGNAFFPRILNTFQGEANEPLLVVGIGYDTHKAFDTELRTRDYTPRVQGEKFKKGGGDEEFLHFIKNTLLPFLQERYKLGQKAIFGHSFGGLFVLNALLDESELFDFYFINSPSLWWGEASFLPRNLRLVSCPHIFITQGELEQSEKRHKDRFSPLNAKDLATRLSKESLCEAKFIVFKGQNHGSVIAKDIEFALKEFLNTH